ncbi:MAG: bifunctional folylpolyglutamate synthase/dihydrofolate synthase [Bacteroidales bacterium]|nr:bifunctional folylpolyglutamate synthase/dihydrofolate synthase [Bacteroidales bacterium]
MNYNQCLEFMFNQLPMYQRIGSAAYKADLNTTLAIDKLLNHPHKNYKTIHIAGTNGKGSVSHSIASILQAKGLKTGLYTSPHLKDYRERIRINGEKISQEYVCQFLNKYKKDFDKIKPSFFEMTFAMATEYFSENNIDIAVIETGMGGRLDSTNIISPIFSVITNISFDHVRFLGNTIEEIAEEKAGIIKSNIPVIIGETQKETKPVFINKAKKEKTKILFADRNFSIQNNNNNGSSLKANYEILKKGKLYIKNLKCPLLGLYQNKNLLTVIQATELINETFIKISKDTIKQGIENVITGTGLMGRWQILSEKPMIICDTGHNEAGIQFVTEQIKQTPYNKLHFVIGMVNDKNISHILKLLPVEAKYYFCKADIPRGLNQDILAEEAKSIGLKGETFNSVNQAFEAAKNNADDDDLIFVGGSNFTVAEIL